MLEVASGERLIRETLLVRPQRSAVSEFCTELTTLTQAEVDAGVPFVVACQTLREKYLSKSRTWASYGDYDRRQFERQCAAWRIAYPFGPTHINVKNLMALKHRPKREVGMARALDMLKLPLEGTHHRASTGESAYPCCNSIWMACEQQTELNDLVGLKEILNRQTQRPKSELLQRQYHPAGILRRPLQPDVDALGIARAAVYRHGIASHNQISHLISV